VVTDASGNVVAELGHFPFGESWYNGSGDKLMFTTYERDAETGNDYAQARQYVNGIARFSSLDPLAGSIGDPQSLNRYSYVRNMPVMLVDPAGADPICYAVADNEPDSADDNYPSGGHSYRRYRFGEPEPYIYPCSSSGGDGGGDGGFEGLGGPMFTDLIAQLGGENWFQR